MARHHLLEIHDQEWCPNVLRDAATDYLQFVTHLANPYAPVADRLRAALHASGAARIVDLCSGAGGPWLKLHPLLAGESAPAPPVVLTDRFPNVAGFERVNVESYGQVRFDPRPIDARNVPPDLDGFRTLFASFHHFKPPNATGILADAVRQRQGIAVLEITHRSPVAVALMGLTPLLVWLSTPFIRPFRWSRVLWTYVIPVLPLLILFDGIVSCLRTYAPDELMDLTQRLGDHGYTWEIGEETAGPGPVPVTYLVGYPEEAGPNG